jgi:hypothetical protein
VNKDKIPSSNISQNEKVKRYLDTDVRLWSMRDAVCNVIKLKIKSLGYIEYIEKPPV